MAEMVSNTDDYIDSRDVIARIEEIESDPDYCDAETGEFIIDLVNEDERREYDALVEFRDANESVSEWQYGACFIRDSYFTDYVRELLQDIGDLPNGIPHYIVIDWEETANNIRQDYTDAEFDGETYWVRA